MWYGEFGLQGRKFERHIIDQVVDGLRSRGGATPGGDTPGSGDSLLLLGEAGIGKSALLRYAADRAGDARVLATGGVPAEAALPFAGLHALLGPVLHLLPELPARQAAALSAAFALVPATGVDPFALAAGTFQLLAAAARERPLLVLVDDLQSLDETSREALLFAARRTPVEGIATLLAATADGPGCGAENGLRAHRVPRLDPASARELLLRASPSPVDGAVADRLVDAAGGLPLALVDLPAALTPAQLAGAAPVRDPLPAGPEARRVFGPRLAALDPAVRAALLVAAAAGDAGFTATIDAVAALGIDIAALAAAEAAGLVRMEEDGVAFRNPLLRSVAYHEAAPANRRAAHRALAAVTAQVPRAWHLAAAALRPDEETADELERTAAREAAHLPVPEAAQLVERAAELTGPEERRAARLVSAAESWQLAGAGERVRDLVDRAGRLTGDLAVRGRAQDLMAREELRRGRAGHAHRQLAREAARVRGTAPAVAAALLLDAAAGARLAGDTAAALVAVRQARLVSGAANGALVVEHAAVLACAGRLTEARALLDERRADLEKEVLAGGGHRTLWTGLPSLLARLGELDAALLLVDDLVSRCRLLDVTGLLPGLLVTRAELHLRAGDWDTAAADAGEATTAAGRLGQDGDAAAAQVCLGRIAAARGARAQCAAHLAQAREVRTRGQLGALAVPVEAAAGLLELGEGDHEAAYARLEQIVRQVEAGLAPDPGAVCWLPDFVEAAVRVSRPDEARRVVAAVSPHAAGSPPFAAAVARSRALLAAGTDAAEQWFHAALRVDGAGAEPFERARDALCYGEWLRRHDRAGEAAPRLAAARATFETLGAAPWAGRAGRALSAVDKIPSGTEDAAPGPRTPLPRLTEQERRVTLLVGRGATNREAARELFLSTKTIEFHLRSVYRKLGVRSRAELANLVGRSAGDIPGTGAGQTLGR
jgi:DNA-binding CsgD family transcriptional regulator